MDVMYLQCGLVVVSELSQIAGVEVTTFTSKYTRPSHQVLYSTSHGCHICIYVGMLEVYWRIQFIPHSFLYI